MKTTMSMTLKTFDTCKHTNEYHQEYRKSRELAKVLEYSDYRNFLHVVDKAKEACKNSRNIVSEHFGDVTEPQKSRNQHGEVEGQMILNPSNSRGLGKRNDGMLSG